MARGEPAPRPAEYSQPEILPGQDTRLMAYVSTHNGKEVITLAGCSSPLALTTELYQARPELQTSLYCVKIVKEVLQLIELQPNGTRVEHWIPYGQTTQVFINCDLMNAGELATYLGPQPDLNAQTVYAVPFGSEEYHTFHGNTDMLYNPKVDPDFSRKQAQRKC